MPVKGGGTRKTWRRRIVVAAFIGLVGFAGFLLTTRSSQLDGDKRRGDEAVSYFEQFTGPLNGDWPIEVDLPEHPYTGLICANDQCPTEHRPGSVISIADGLDAAQAEATFDALLLSAQAQGSVVSCGQPWLEDPANPTFSHRGDAVLLGPGDLEWTVAAGVIRTSGEVSIVINTQLTVDGGFASRRSC